MNFISALLRSSPIWDRRTESSREKNPGSDAKALAGKLDRAKRQTISDRPGATLSEQIYGLAIVARCSLPFSFQPAQETRNIVPGAV